MVHPHPDLTEDLTRKVAQLAKLELSQSEVEIFTPQLKEILNWIEQLQEVNVKGVEPLTSITKSDSPTPMRNDVVKPAHRNLDGAPKILECAPDVFENGFKVPPILEMLIKN